MPSRNYNYRLSVFLAIWVFFGFSCAPVYFSQSGSIQNQQKRKKDIPQSRPTIVVNLISEARYLPAEFAADILLKVAESKKTLDKEWKKELLEEAFRFAGKAQYPVKRTIIPLPGISVDTNPNYLSSAFSFGLDNLSLRVRAIKAMLRLDKLRARELLSEIPTKMPLEPLTCEDILAFQVTEFYEVLTSIGKETFNSQEAELGLRVNFLSPYIENATSPSQVKPIIDLLMAFRDSPAEFAALERVFISTLKRISQDDRSFSYSIMREPITRGIYEMSRIHYRDEALTNNLFGAFRAYLLNNLKATRCMDNLRADEKILPNYIHDANFLFVKNPLSPEDIKHIEVKPVPQISEYWATREAHRFIEEIRGLSWRENGQEVSEANKLTLEWQQRVIDYLTKLERWEGGAEKSPLDAFHQKCIVYRGLLKLVPESTLQQRIAQSYVQYLSQPGLKEMSRIEWYLHFSFLLEKASNFTDKKDNTFMGLISNSPDATMRLYAQLQIMQF
jgi:hypothetical protein